MLPLKNKRQQPPVQAADAVCFKGFFTAHLRPSMRDWPVQSPLSPYRRKS